MDKETAEAPKKNPIPLPISFGNMGKVTDTGKKLLAAVEYLAHFSIITPKKAARMVAKIKTKHKYPIGQHRN